MPKTQDNQLAMDAAVDRFNWCADNVTPIPAAMECMEQAAASFDRAYYREYGQ